MTTRAVDALFYRRDRDGWQICSATGYVYARITSNGGLWRWETIRVPLREGFCWTLGEAKQKAAEALRT